MGIGGAKAPRGHGSNVLFLFLWRIPFINHLPKGISRLVTSLFYSPGSCRYRGSYFSITESVADFPRWLPLKSIAALSVSPVSLHDWWFGVLLPAAAALSWVSAGVLADSQCLSFPNYVTCW